MNDRSQNWILKRLLTCACAVIIMWGVRQASHIIGIVLLALLLAFCVLPVPRWLIRRFHTSKTVAIIVTVLLVALAHVVVSLLLTVTSIRIKARLPAYERQCTLVFERGQDFLLKHGATIPNDSIPGKSSSGQIVAFAEAILPKAIGIFSDRLLIALLSLLFLAEMAEEQGKQTRIARNLAYYGRDVQPFILVMAQTGAITAVAVFVLLIALGVEFPFLWSLIYFFLHFIPDLGIVLSVVPPAVVSLITLGWKRALLVTAGILILNALSDYVLKPKLMKKELDISFLEIMLSLLLWSFLLGSWGAILAIPLTLALRRTVFRVPHEEELARAAPE